MEDIRIYEQVAKNTEAIHNVKRDVKEVKNDMKVVRKHVTNDLTHEVADIKTDLAEIRLSLALSDTARNRWIDRGLKLLPYVAIICFAAFLWYAGEAM